MSLSISSTEGSSATVDNCLSDNCKDYALCGGVAPAAVAANDVVIANNVINNMNNSVPSAPLAPLSPSVSQGNGGPLVVTPNGSGSLLKNMVAPPKEWACLRDDGACVRVLPPSLSSVPHYRTAGDCASACFFERK